LDVSLRKVSVKLGGVYVLRGVTLSFGLGLHLVLGHNGAGKSTLLKVIPCLVKPSEGEVRIGGVDPCRESRKILAKLVGYVWQNPFHGFVEATARDEISLILRLSGAQGNWGIVERLVPPDLLDRDPFTLSGGEARRVSIASVLVADQPVWLLDEPFDYLDGEGISAVEEIIRDGVKRGKTVIVSSSSVSYLELEPDTVTVLYRGEIHFHGKPSQLDVSELRKVGLYVPRRLSCL